MINGLYDSFFDQEKNPSISRLQETPLTFKVKHFLRVKGCLKKYFTQNGLGSKQSLLS